MTLQLLQIRQKLLSTDQSGESAYESPTRRVSLVQSGPHHHLIEN
jgi:hypothetical protein